LSEGGLLRRHGRLEGGDLSGRVELILIDTNLQIRIVRIDQQRRPGLKRSNDAVG
jgi:hypothetical protein